MNVYAKFRFSKCTETSFRPGLDPPQTCRAAWGAYDVPPDPLVGWGGGYPSPLFFPLRRLDFGAGARLTVPAVLFLKIQHWLVTNVTKVNCN